MRRNKSKRSNRRGRRSQGSLGKKAAAILTPVCFLTAAGFAMAYYASIEEQGADFCYERPNQHKSAIFIDNSLVQLSSAHIRDYRRGLENAYEVAPANSKILIYTTAGTTNGSIADPVFIQCKPPATVYEQERIGAPSKTAPQLNRDAEEAQHRYASEIDRLIEEVQDPDKLAGDSPILSQIQAISRDRRFQGRRRSLTALTDGWENSETARFCIRKGDMPAYNIFETKQAYQEIKPKSFEGIDVSILLVEHGELSTSNAPYCTNHELRTWWQDYFKGNDASNVFVTRLRHWAGN